MKTFKSHMDLMVLRADYSFIVTINQITKFYAEFDTISTACRERRAHNTEIQYS